MNMTSYILVAVLSLALPLLSSCTPTTPNELDKLGMVSMSIKSKPFQLWIADSSDEQLKGLMFVTAEQMAPLPDGADRGMIFIFERDQTNSFWMKNTIIPLDIAYVASNGTVVSTYTMAALDERVNQYPPSSPYRYVIEVNANRLVELGVRKGDKLEIPASALNRKP